MTRAQEFLDNFLAHAYDPVKAREYYLRTRQLKGRKKGLAQVPGGREPAKGLTAPPRATAVKKAAPAPKGANRMQVLNARLTRLTEILDLLDSRVAAAQARSGVEGVAKKTAASKKAASTKTSKDKPKSASDKKADAKAAAERYEKNKTSETSKGAQAVQDEIEEVQKKIAEARDELKAALAKARASSPKPKAAPSRPTAVVKKAEGRPSK